LFAIEPLARRIDQGDQHRAGLLQSSPLSFDSIRNSPDGSGPSFPRLRRTDFVAAMTQHLIRARLWLAGRGCL
jgi:hypothetical protein